MEEQEAKIARELADFAQKFPDVYTRAKGDPDTIPDEVWRAVSQGKPLTAAYGEYVAKEYAEQTRQQAERNRERSTGSMRSSGGSLRRKDAFQAALNG